MPNFPYFSFIGKMKCKIEIPQDNGENYYISEFKIDEDEELFLRRVYKTYNIVDASFYIYFNSKDFLLDDKSLDYFKFLKFINNFVNSSFIEDMSGIYWHNFQKIFSSKILLANLNYGIVKNESENLFRILFFQKQEEEQHYFIFSYFLLKEMELEKIFIEESKNINDNYLVLKFVAGKSLNIQKNNIENANIEEGEIFSFSPKGKEIISMNYANDEKRIVTFFNKKYNKQNI